MKNETITQDQQIQNQQVTIESLNRKVERLERELEKCLPQESDTMRESVADTETDEVFENATYFMERLAEAVLRLTPGAEPDFPTWMKLKDLLLTHPNAKKHLADPDFAHGVYIVSRVSERCLCMYHLGTEEEHENYRDVEFGPKGPGSNPFYHRYRQSAPLILLGATNASEELHEIDFARTLRAFNKIKEVLPQASSHFDNHVEYAETELIIDTMIFALVYLLRVLRKEN